MPELASQPDIQPYIFFGFLRLFVEFLIGAAVVYGLYFLFKSPSSMESTPESRNKTLRSLYLYAAAFVGLITIIFAGSSLISTTLKATIFTKADTYTVPSVEEDCSAERLKENPKLTREACEKKAADSKKSREFALAANRSASYASNISFLLVGIPLFAFHIRKAQRNRNDTV